MNDNSLQNIKLHNVMLVVISVASIGAIVESVTQNWEFWVPPLITVGLIACWIIHVSHYRDDRFREDFFLIFSMLVAFYHGAHETSYFDVIVISSLLLVVSTLLKRKILNTKKSIKRLITV